MSKRVLIISPHFPPVNAPDMHRVRMSLPYFHEFGWEPYVLGVAPSGADSLDPVLSLTIPDDVPVERVRSIPAPITRALGIGNVALRAMPWLALVGARLIRRHRIDLVYFSTTMFLSMPLGRVWRRMLGVPYVLDIQDPWLSDYYETHPEVASPPKYGIAHRLHAALEPWTMRRVGGLVAVSSAYIDTLRQRYPWITGDTCATIPFAASETDFALVASQPQPNSLFTPGDGELHAVYIGRGGDDLAPALRILFAAVRALGAAQPGAPLLRMHFVGTDYATDARARKTVEPVAAEIDPALHVEEQTSRVPYFQALQIMREADFLILVGSDDPQYTASKVYPYLLSRKPIVAVVHEQSGLVPLLRDSGALMVTFGDGDHATATHQLREGLAQMLTRLPYETEMSPAVARACSAREMTRAQCSLFDRVVGAAA